jgi:hypothetical protein
VTPLPSTAKEFNVRKLIHGKPDPRPQTSLRVDPIDN